MDDVLSVVQLVDGEFLLQLWIDEAPWLWPPVWSAPTIASRTVRQRIIKWRVDDDEWWFLWPLSIVHYFLFFDYPIFRGGVGLYLFPRREMHQHVSCCAEVKRSKLRAKIRAAKSQEYSSYLINSSLIHFTQSISLSGLASLISNTWYTFSGLLFHLTNPSLVNDLPIPSYPCRL